MQARYWLGKYWLNIGLDRLSLVKMAYVLTWIS